MPRSDTPHHGACPRLTGRGRRVFPLGITYILPQFKKPATESIGFLQSWLTEAGRPRPTADSEAEEACSPAYHYPDHRPSSSEHRESFQALKQG